MLCLRPAPAVCTVLQKYYLQPHVGAQRKGGGVGEIWHFEFRVGAEAKASYWETSPAFDLPSQTHENNNTLIYQHMKSCMHVNINLNAHFPKSFSDTHSISTQNFSLCACERRGSLLRHAQEHAIPKMYFLEENKFQNLQSTLFYQR